MEIAVDERYPPAVEAAAYFLVAEALTNVAKYAQATLAQVELHRAGHELVVTVVDDGVGGADMDAGSGLRGLQDRLSAVDGTLAIESPPGGGTRLRATLPAGVEQAAVSA
jgi:signal transduction histidine kinase